MRKQRTFRSLAVTLALSFSALIVIALLIAGSLQMYFSFRAQRQVISENQKLVAINTAASVDHFLQQKFDVLEAASSRSNLITASGDVREKTLDRFMGLEPVFRQLALYDADTIERIKVSRIADSISLLTQCRREELFHKVSLKEVYAGPVYIDDATSEPMMIMAVPVTDVFGNYQGAMIAESNLKFLWDLMGQIKIGENGQAYVVEEQGYLIAYKDIGRVLKRENLSRLAPVELFIQKKAAVGEISMEPSRGILDATVLTTQVHLKTPNWAVIVELPIKEAYRPILMTLILSAMVMLLSLVIAILSGIYLSRRLTKPIIELRDAAGKIGRGELSLAMDIHSNSEIGDLAESFNKMVRDLESTTVSKNALIKEVNERKQVERILMESEQKMKAILEASPIGIGLVNHGTLEWANDTLFALAGYEKNSLLGQKVSMLYSDNREYSRVEEELSAGITDSRTGSVETQWIRADQSILDCVLGSRPLDPVDPGKGRILTVRDISESKRLQAKLMRAQKMEVLGTLAAGVAHDLNNILGAIVGYPELLIMDMPEENPQRAPLLTIKKAGERAAAIVQDLLMLARRGVSINEVVNLGQVIAEFLKSPEYEQILSWHPDVTVKTDLDAPLLNTPGLGFNLHKVLTNLVSNAAESMPDGGKIVISARNVQLAHPIEGYENIDAGEYVTLAVSDTGTGISKEEAAKIFEPFYTKKKMGRSGTGLGMTIVWGAVKDLNGYMDIDSKEGVGTTFTLYFPATQKGLIAREHSMSVNAYMAKGESILVVDDVEEQRVVLSRILTRLGYRVVAVPSGEMAVEYMRDHAADLLVLDMIMDPGINGLETYRRILKLHPNQKAIVATGFSETDHVKETLRLGAGAYIQKPYSIEKIGRAIRDALDQ